MRLLLHAKHAASDFPRIVVKSPDTDVLVLCYSQFSSRGPSLCKALPGVHALTVCDSMSSFYGIGKKKAWNDIEKSTEFQIALGRLAEVYGKKIFADFIPQLRNLEQL